MTVLNKVMWPLDLLGSSLVLSEDTGGGFSVASTWAGVDGGTFSLDTSGRYTALLDAIQTQFSTDGANTYEWQPVDSDSFGRDDFRLKLVRTAGTANFRLNGTEQIMVQLGADAASDVLTASSGEIEFPNHYDGCWVLPKFYQYHDERERPRQDVKVVVTNGDDVYTASKNQKRNRYFHWLAVPGELVFKDAVDFSWRRGDLSADEVNASFEHFWDTVLKVGKEFIVIHDIPRGSESLDEGDYGYYACKLIDSSAIEDMWVLLDDRIGEFGEEIYDIMMTVREIAIVHPS